MPDQEAITRGILFEQSVAESLGGKVQPGSGNKPFAPLDCDCCGGLLLSCKSEVHITLSRIRRYLYEAIDKAHGTGKIPALAVDDVDNNDQLIVMRMRDFVTALTDVKLESKINKSSEKRERADIPIMLR
jgi:hypothetical protein